MARIWVEIENAAGARLGDGPILTASQWDGTRRLKAAGSFSFTMPAGDPRADLVQVGRVARCYTVQGERIVEKGAGLIGKIGAQVGGAGLLEVSGDDLCRELTHRRVGNLQLFDTVVVHPASTFQHGTSEYFLNGAVDLQVGDTSTFASISPNSSTNNWMISDSLPFRAVRVAMGPRKYSGSTALKFQYYDAKEVSWKDLTIVDGTKVSNASLAQSGDITFEAPENWAPMPGYSLYDVRMWIDGCGTLDVCDVAIIRDQPTPNALEKLISVMDGAWSLDTQIGYATISRATELGNNLVPAGDFEGAGTGLADDGASDTWNGFTNVGVNDASGNKIEAVSGGYVGRFACVIRHATTGAESSPEIYTDVTGLRESADYLLTVWTHGDGAAQGRLRVEDRSHLVTNHPQYLTPRIYTGATSAAWQQVRVEFTTPLGCTAIRIRLYGADEALALGSVTWDGIELRERLGGEVFYQCANESVLEILGKIAEQTGENWIKSPVGRRVAWLRKDQRNSGITCVNASARRPLTGEDTGLIVDANEEQSAYELATRVMATGAGSGEDRLTMAEATRPVPTGYTLDRAANCLIRPAAESALGRIDAVIEFPEVTTQGVGPDQKRFAANALFDRAYEWLKTHTATNTHRITGDVPRAYTLTLTGCNRLILPGYLVRMVYRKVENGYVALDINALLWVLASTERVSSAGTETVALDVATVSVRPLTTDGERLARQIQQARAMRAHGV